MKNSPFNLEDKLAVVTGGAGLIGTAICRELTNHNCRVVIADNDIEQAQKVASELPGAEAMTVDITKDNSVAEFSEKIKNQYGKVDVLVNNAYPRSPGYGCDMEEVSMQQWEFNLNAHLGGYFRVIKYFIPQMKKMDTASIINMASIYGIQGPDFSVYKGTEMTCPVEYSAIKGGLINLTRYLASYLGEYNIRVNSISPGGVFDNQPDTFVENYRKKTPLNRMAKSEDIGGAVVYLASDASSYVSGHNLVVDGGFTVC
jgi:NAD(P)-dependent dehydrogenase (short-subunit alcohol dehydrogenase family)